MARSIRIRLPAILAFGLLCGIVGYYVGRRVEPHGMGQSLDKVEPKIATKVGLRTQSSSDPAGDLQQILADRTSVSSRKQKFSEYLEHRLLAGQSAVLLQELKALPGSPDRTDALLRLAIARPSDRTMREWSDALLAGLQGVEKSSVSSALAHTWAESDARGAFDQALIEPDAGYRGALLDESMVRLAQEDAPAAASRLVRSRSDLGAGFASAVARLCEVWAETDPQAAKKWVAEHSADWLAYERDEANSMIVTTMAREYPGEAVQELAIISEPERRELALREIFAHWASSDPAGAAAALPDYRPGHDVELATEVALTWSDYDYPATVKWVKSSAAIPDELRASVLKRLEDAQGGLTTDAAASE